MVRWQDFIHKNYPNHRLNEGCKILFISYWVFQDDRQTATCHHISNKYYLYIHTSTRTHMHLQNAPSPTTVAVLKFLSIWVPKLFVYPTTKTLILHAPTPQIFVDKIVCKYYLICREWCSQLFCILSFNVVIFFYARTLISHIFIKMKILNGKNGVVAASTLQIQLMSSISIPKTSPLLKLYADTCILHTSIFMFRENYCLATLNGMMNVRALVQMTLGLSACLMEFLLSSASAAATAAAAMFKQMKKSSWQ